MTNERLEELFAENGLLVRNFIEAKTDWEYVTANARRPTGFYNSSSVEYHLEYYREIRKLKSRSSVVSWNGKPVAVFVLEIECDSNVRAITSSGGNVREPLYVDGLQKKTIQKINEALWRFILELEQIGYVATFEYEVRDDVLSDWYITLINQRKLNEVLHYLYLDLQMDLGDIKKGFRKSYRPLVTKIKDTWDLRVLHSATANLMQHFRILREFHFEVAGKRTRSGQSWQIQAKMVRRGDAFVICVFDSEKLVGFGLFEKSERDCIYAVGVYDRTMTHEPIGHVVQFKAIEYMKQLGLSEYKIGIRFFEKQQPYATEKELSISYFKEGFASGIRPAMIFE